MFGAWPSRAAFPERCNASDIGTEPDALALFLWAELHIFRPCSEPPNATCNNNRSS